MDRPPAVEHLVPTPDPHREPHLEDRVRDPDLLGETGREVQQPEGPVDHPVDVSQELQGFRHQRFDDLPGRNVQPVGNVIARGETVVQDVVNDRFAVTIVAGIDGVFLALDIAFDQEAGFAEHVFRKVPSGTGHVFGNPFPCGCPVARITHDMHTDAEEPDRRFDNEGIQLGRRRIVFQLSR